jgi:transposase
MRCIALDVHRDFCEVAIAEAGEVRLAGRVTTDPEALELFARSLGSTDRVALEATVTGLRSRGSSSHMSIASCLRTRRR